MTIRVLFGYPGPDFDFLVFCWLKGVGGWLKGVGMFKVVFSFPIILFAF